MKNNRKTDENTNGAAIPVKNGIVNFDITFNAFCDARAGTITPETRSESIFEQSYIFTNGVFMAIYRLSLDYANHNYEADKLAIVESCICLSAIGKAFAGKMYEEFHELQSLKGGKNDGYE